MPETAMDRNSDRFRHTFITMIKQHKNDHNSLRHCSDEELLSLYCEGNKLAFEILYNKHKDSLYRFILRKNNNQTALSEEIFQEVWINVIKNRQQFKYHSKFSSWLYQISRNKIIDTARHASSRKDSLHDSSESVALKDMSPQPDHRTQLEICIEMLQKFVLQLPDEQKEAFVLKHDTDKNIDELSELTNTSHETFKSRLRYAMKKLRDWLPDECL